MMWPDRKAHERGGMTETPEPLDVVEIVGKKGALCRAAAALSSDAVGVLRRGTVVEVLERAVVGGTERLRLRVAGASAWCSAKLARPAAAPSHGWEVRTDGGWSAFDVDDAGDDVDAMLEASLARMDEAPVAFTKNRMRYEVSVLGLEQRNTRFGTCRKVRRRARRRPRAPRLGGPAAATRVFAVSDIHADYEENWAWLEGLPVGPYRGDVLLVAGDLGHTLPLLAAAFLKLKAVFGEVCFVAGNHELWVGDFDEDARSAKGFSSKAQPRVLEKLDPSFVARARALATAACAAVPRRGPALDSVVKFERILALCDALGVRTKPLRVAVGDGDDLWVCPIAAWYVHGFGTPSPHPDAVAQARSEFTDFTLCAWPDDVDAAPSRFDGDAGPAAYFAARNPPLPEPSTRVITFSHFLPRPELMPAKRPPSAARLDLVAGDRRVDAALRARGSRLHVFGHTHVNWDACADGVHYVQNALRYPNERRMWTSRVDSVHRCGAAPRRSSNACVPVDPEKRAADALDALRIWSSEDPDDFCILPNRCSACKFADPPQSD